MCLSGEKGGAREHRNINTPQPRLAVWLLNSGAYHRLDKPPILAAEGIRPSVLRVAGAAAYIEQ